VDVLLYAGIGPKTRPLTFPVPYKAYMGPSIGDLFFASEETLRATLARYRGQTVAFHAEDPEILTRSKHAASHALRRPPEAESRAVETAISICESFQIEPHICHLSTADGLEIIRAARACGMHVSCEVAPHHLFYDQDNVAGYSHPGYLQVNPPIRSRLDRIALLEAFSRGEIDYLATDHAPHTLEEKDSGISGMPQLDTVGAFVFWLRSEGIPWHIIRQACAERPGKFLSRYLPCLYGKIEKNFVGSLTILRAQRQTVRRTNLKSRAGWSPFEGCTFSGGVSHTVVRGKIYPQIEE
jgi:dihydroorotase